MIQWFKNTFPDTYEFIRNFFKALNNRPGGHSLRKWLSIGVFWILGVVCVEYTNSDNLVAVASVLSALITSLIITNTVGNYQEQKLNIPPKDESAG